MGPTREQIEVAAYHRWQRRNGAHGGNHDDWVAAEKDLAFGLNYRYTAKHRLDGPPVLLGKLESESEAESQAGRRRRRCRYCERVAPAAEFNDPAPPAVPPLPGAGDALRVWDECDECRGAYESTLAGAFAAFAHPLLRPSPAWHPGSVPADALKELVRLGLSVVPQAELHHLGDTLEWVANPDHARDAALLAELDLGCHVYLTPEPVPVPFVALARRVDDSAPWPYLLFFLAVSRVVFQTHLPLCSRDEEFEGARGRGPELSMSLGHGPDHRASACVYLPVAKPSRATPAEVRHYVAAS